MNCSISFVSFQAGEFFCSAQSSAAAQQREFEARNTGEGSVDSPLLLEQVQICFPFFLQRLKFCYFCQYND